MLIFDLKMFITFVNDVKLQNFDLVSKFQFLAHICGVIVEKLKGGLRRVKFWYFFLVGIFAKEKSKISSFSVQAIIVK